jgi:antitoxin component YwqK of YwqJK toxin-antitoxin module
MKVARFTSATLGICRAMARAGFGMVCYQSGSLASEGNYADGVEQGPWRDYHENGKLASEGMYERGQEVGEWKYWQADGSVFRAALDHR